MKHKDIELTFAIEKGVDLKNRRLFLHGDVEDNVALIVRAMYFLNEESKAAPIELFISSYGGSVDDTFALHDVTRTLRAPVHTTALGKCMSAAPLLVACGHKGQRWATANTLFMLHDSKLEAEVVRPKQMAALAAIEEQRSEDYARLLTEYTKMPYRHWRRLSGSSVDRFFTAEKALEWGLIDAIWQEQE